MFYKDNSDKIYYAMLVFFTVAIGGFGWFVMNVK